MALAAPERDLLLIRHSAVLVQKHKPAKEWSLSILGRDRCLQFAPIISTYEPTLFVTSNENKAIETGIILAEALGTPVRIAQNLHEHDRQGMPYYDNQQEFDHAVCRFFANPDQHVFGNETAAQASQRIDSAISNLVTQRKGHNLALVSHGTVLTLFVNLYNQQIDPVPFWEGLRMPCAVRLRLPDMKFQELILPSTTPENPLSPGGIPRPDDFRH